MIDPGLEGRGALVTGVNNPEGIGASVARALAAQGARLFLTYLREDPGSPGGPRAEPSLERYRRLQASGPEALVGEIRSSGRQVAMLEADLSDIQEAPAVFDAAEAFLGEISVLVHSAAHWEPDSFLEGSDARRIDAASHDRHFAVNSRATALLVAEFAHRFRRGLDGGGRVILISTDGASGHAGAVSYGASKHAAESLARAAAWELGPEGITVNVVSPGPVQTGWIDKELEEEIIRQIPVRRIGTPEDVAHAVLFLASAQASWVTGQVLYVGGGKVMPL